VIEYVTSLEGVEAEDLDGFFVEWPTRPSTRSHLELLRGSEQVVLARDGESGQVVGFVNAIGDGVLSAFVPLLEVLPAHQGRGIGTELVRRILALLDERYMVDVCCDDDLVPFYERFDMVRVNGMVRRAPSSIPR
jgi:ribosomal protein S18 acetylase RimI-like enzyme